MGTNVFIPPDLYSRRALVSLATRLKITPSQQAAYTQGVIAECGGDGRGVLCISRSITTEDSWKHCQEYS